MTSRARRPRISTSCTVDPLVTLTGLTGDRSRVLRLPEPPDASPGELREQLLAGSYGKPFLVEDHERRALVFAIEGGVQSEMRLDDPVALVNDYTRKMMAFLLFCPRPRHVVMIGLGGGSLLKFCRRHLPRTRLTVVEIDATVIALRGHFQVPPDDELLRVVHADGAQHIADMADSVERADVVIVDAYDRRGLARAVASRGFLASATRVLEVGGVFVMNLAAYESDCAWMLQMIRSVFGGPVMSVRTGWGGNTIAFAGSALGDVETLRSVPARARQLHDELGLNFRRLPTLVCRHLRKVQAGPIAGG
jgi:spermidine synthase